MQTTAQHPEELRIQVRQHIYPNSLVEREAVDSVDRAVFDRVRAHEQALVEQARTARESARVDEDAGLQIAVALRGEVVRALDGPVSEVDLAAVAVRYKELRVMAEQAIDALNRAAADEEYRRPKLAAPYEDLVALWTKWPMVRPTI